MPELPQRTGSGHARWTAQGIPSTVQNRHWQTLYQRPDPYSKSSACNDVSVIRRRTESVVVPCAALDSRAAKYWQFSVNELGELDIAAQIDYIHMVILYISQSKTTILAIIHFSC